MAMAKVTPDVKPLSQPTSAACWYSCLRMLFQWKRDKGESKDPDKILEMMDKSPNLWPWEMKDNWGIDVGECRETARYLGLTATGDGELEAASLKQVLEKHGPVWIAGNWGSGNHVIVVTACNPDDGRIRYINPYQNHNLSDSPGTISWLNGRGSLWKNCDASVMYW
ncbi:MAG TPA: papain-like cysteine protease family protein [Pyrinomonadaceae bacterium]|nr:papain-like cysteine protease family protein [Pyrinomonadaceae bacterium]